MKRKKKSRDKKFGGHFLQLENMWNAKGYVFNDEKVQVETCEKDIF